MWYLSGNRDEQAITEAHRFMIDRPRARQHLAFGFGIHRCLGNRLAELQLCILWEEILRSFSGDRGRRPACPGALGLRAWLQRLARADSSMMAALGQNLGPARA